MTSRCFTYGSLMCEDIMSAVCGHPCAAVDAELAGYRRHPVRDTDYPAIMPAPDARVRGRLYPGITSTDWARLDAFEGPQYSREAVRVTLGDGRAAEAWVYVFRPAYRALLLPEEWDFEHFLAQGKARFEARHLGFRQSRQ